MSMRTFQEIEIILEAHYDTIFAFSVQALGCREEAQDLTHDVCLSLAEKLPEFRGECRVTTWLYRIVLNAARDRIRARHRRARLDDAWRDHAAAACDSNARASAAREWLSDAMKVLDETDRVMIALAVSAGFTQAETAEILEMSPGTVAWRMSEIRRKLSKQADREGEFA